MIFVFGSNLAGIHGAGAAKYAYYAEGAQRGIGVGMCGNSYALPTKNHQVQTMPLNVIKKFVDEFIEFAKLNPDLKFKVTRIGCGLAGYKDSDIAPMFEHAPVNCYFDTMWAPELTRADERNFWGTM